MAELLVPLYDRLVIEELHEKTSAGGILLTGDDVKVRARVISVGDGRVTEEGKVLPLIVKVGDIVVYYKGFGTVKENIEGKDVLIISESDILAIVKEVEDV